jgi:hypothetical protein
MDLFVVPTIGFDLLYVLVIVRLARRDLVWINVTTNPTAEWIALLAERLGRKADRIDPARVRRPCDCPGRRHLRRILTKYAAYCNELRTHRPLDKDAPIHRAIQHVGRIISAPILCGLHHHYCRI